MEFKKPEYRELWGIIGFEPPMESMMFCYAVGQCVVNMPQLDEAFGKRDPEYDPKGCTYQGKPASFMEYVQLKYGDRAVELINILTPQ